MLLNLILLELTQAVSDLSSVQKAKSIQLYLLMVHQIKRIRISYSFKLLTKCFNLLIKMNKI